MCVIAQHYSSATLVSAFFYSCKEKFGASLKKILFFCFFKIASLRNCPIRFVSVCIFAAPEFVSQEQAPLFTVGDTFGQICWLYSLSERLSDKCYLYIHCRRDFRKNLLPLYSLSERLSDKSVASIFIVGDTFGQICCLYIHLRRDFWTNLFPESSGYVLRPVAFSEHLVTLWKLHGVIHQKTVFLVFTAATTSNGRPAGKGISCLPWNPQYHYLVTMISPDHIPSQFNTITPAHVCDINRKSFKTLQSLSTIYN